MKIGRLSIGARKSSEPGRYVLASWAYATGYWRWCLDFSRNGGQFRFGPSFGAGTIYSAAPGHFGCWLRTPLGSFSFTTQPRFDAMKVARA